MFCRSCWANLPDGTERCPKCQHDPRVPMSPPPDPVATASPPPPPPRLPPGPAKGRPSNLARVNMALAALLVAGIGGPLLMHWWEERRTPRGPAARESPAAALAPLPEPSMPRAIQPSPASATDDPDARAATEAYTLFERGDIASACERYRQLAAQSR